MRASILSATFVLIAASCGGSGLSTDKNDMTAVVDMTMTSSVDLLTNLPIGPDLAGRDFAGISCGAQTCSAGETCCNTYNASNMSLTQMCSTGGMCGDGGIQATCDGPEDCTSTGGNCCINVDSMGAKDTTGSAMCTSSCPGSAAQANGATTVSTKLCHNAADCKNYSGSSPFGDLPFNACCSYPGVSFMICAPPLLTALSSSVKCTQ